MDMAHDMDLAASAWVNADRAGAGRNIKVRLRRNRERAVEIAVRCRSSDEITSFDMCKLLTVQINHLHKWYGPGLLCIGDAAHAMSPVGGIGINIAIQDAVATANILARPLSLATLARPVPTGTLALVQSRREFAVRLTQFFQAQAHKVLIGILKNPRPIKAPMLVRFASGTPWIRRFMGRVIGMGALPEHVHTPSVTP